MKDSTHGAGSIRWNVRRLKEAGYNVSENAVRTWVKTGQVKATYSGVKAIIVYRNLLDFLGVPKTDGEEKIRL